MTTPRRSGYMLIYLLAALPLIVVIGHVSIEFTGSALRAQRFATEEAADNSARRLLVERMRGDARAADSPVDLTEDPGNRVTLTTPDGTVEYRVADHSVTRALRKDDKKVSETTWKFHHAHCEFHKETLDNGESLVWLRFRASFQLRKNLPSKREYAIALRIGEGGAAR